MNHKRFYDRFCPREISDYLNDYCTFCNKLITESWRHHDVIINHGVIKYIYHGTWDINQKFMGYHGPIVSWKRFLPR